MIEAPASGRTPNPRRRWPAVPVVLLLLAGGATTVALWPSEKPSEATPHSSAAASAAPPPTPTTKPRPPTGAPMADRQAWVAQEATALLATKATALLSGDFRRFAAVATPGDKKAAKELRRRFDNLRALKVTRFEQRIDGPVKLVDKKRNRWRVVTAVDICYVEPACAPDVTMLDSLWAETPAGLRFAGFATHDSNEECNLCLRNAPVIVRPWEATDLAVRVGKRTLVAVPARHRARLADITRRADAAAALADRFTVGDRPVERYRIFVADDAAWKRWYVGYPGRWVAGLALPAAQNSVEVEVRLGELTADFADELLRHELTHVATLRGDAFYNNDDVWWLVEGIADHAQQSTPNADKYYKSDFLRGFLRRHKLTTVRVTPPADDASDADVAARYAIGYHAFSHLMKTYGRARAMTFYEQAVQAGLGLEAASIEAFGKPWSDVDKECVAAVRRAA